MREVIDMRELRKQQKPKYRNKTVELRVTLNKDTFFELKTLKDEMRCGTWMEFFKKILEKKKCLVEKDVVAY